MKKACVWLIVLGVCSVSASGAETTVGPRGQVLVDGKAVVPLAMWSQPPYLFEYHRQLGMNCMVGTHIERGEFRDNGPTVFPAADRSRMGVVTQFREDAMDKPSVWGWLGAALRPGQIERVKRSRERIRAKDSKHLMMGHINAHQFLDGREGEFYKEAFKHTDAVISHVWAEIGGLEKRNLRNVAVFVDRVRELCKDRPGGEVSIWPDINPHKWNGKMRYGGTQYPSPTREELRFQIWLALIHGADGICFFPITFDPFVYSQIPAKNEQELAWNTRLIERMTPVLTAEESPLAIAVTSDVEGGIIDVTTRHAGGRHTVFLVNGQQGEQTVTLKTEGLGSAWQLRDAIGGKPISVTGGRFSEKLPGLALRIWELVPVAAGSAAGGEESGKASP